MFPLTKLASLILSLITEKGTNLTPDICPCMLEGLAFSFFFFFNHFHIFISACTCTCFCSLLKMCNRFSSKFVWFVQVAFPSELYTQTIQYIWNTFLWCHLNFSWSEIYPVVRPLLTTEDIQSETVVYVLLVEGSMCISFRRSRQSTTGFGRTGPLSRMVTRVSPQNPFLQPDPPLFPIST